MDSYLELLRSLGTEERKVFLQSEIVVHEKQWLEKMIDTNRLLDNKSKWAADMARGFIKDYEMYKDDAGADAPESSRELLESADFYTRLAKDLSTSKYSMKEIRKQREMVQWQVKKMKEVEALNRAKKNIKPSPFSKSSVS